MPLFSAIVILLSWDELFVLIARHPHFSTHILMIKTVSWNLIKFLAWCAVLIIAVSIPLLSFPDSSHIVVVLFILLIAIVLFKLSNGFAVSDTLAIRDDAEVVGHIARVNFLVYIEAMFQSSAIPFLRILKHIFCCCPTGGNYLKSISKSMSLSRQGPS
jgi:ABC-type polysaccharide/polyol phosphate export permease